MSIKKNQQNQHREVHNHDAARIAAVVVTIALMLSFVVPFIFAGL